MPLTQQQKDFIHSVETGIQFLLPKSTWCDSGRRMAAFLPEKASIKASSFPLLGSFFKVPKLQFKNKLRQVYGGILALPTDDFNVYACLLNVAIQELNELLEQATKHDTYTSSKRTDIRLFINDGILQAQEFTGVKLTREMNCQLNGSNTQYTLDFNLVWMMLKTKQIQFKCRHTLQICSGADKPTVADDREIADTFRMNAKSIIEVVEKQQLISYQNS